MQIEINTDSVFATPFNGFEEIGPRRSDKEGFVVHGLDGPEADRNTDPVQSCACNLSDVLFRLDDYISWFA